MNLLHLEYFYTVAKEQGFTKASKVLRIQQPAISRMVKQLEDNFGFPLFERVGRQVRLTSQGEEVFAKCRRIFEEVDGLKSSLGQISGVCTGPLMIGASESISSHIIPGVLEEVLREHPKVYPVIFSGPSSILFDRIISGELEFGLFFHIPDLPAKLTMDVVKRVRFHLVVRKDLKNRAAVLESFIGSREIDDTRTRRFPTLERLKKDYPQASIKISSNNLTAHREMVLKGLGVAILPDFLVAQDLKAGRMKDVYLKEVFEFNLKIVQRPTAVLSLNAQVFLSKLRTASSISDL